MITIGRKVSMPPQSELSIPQKPVSSPVFLESWPAIAELVVERRKISKPRMTPTVTLYFDAGRIGGNLNDRAKKQALFATADDVLGLFAALNAKLLADKVDWREGRPWGSSGR